MNKLQATERPQSIDPKRAEIYDHIEKIFRENLAKNTFRILTLFDHKWHKVKEFSHWHGKHGCFIGVDRYPVILPWAEIGAVDYPPTASP